MPIFLCGSSLRYHLRWQSPHYNNKEEVIKKLRLHLNACQRLPLVVFVDQHPLHKTKEVREDCAQRKIFLVYNAPSSSEYNAVERLWLLSKRILRRNVLEAAVLRLRPARVEKMVCESISSVPKRSL